MTWAKIILAGLQAVLAALGLVKDENLREEGERRQREADQNETDSRVKKARKARDDARDLADSGQLPDSAFRD